MIPERLVPGTAAWDLFEVEHKQRYEWAAKYCRDKTVLDVACGIGYGSAILANRGASHVTGIDISPEAIAFGTHQYQAANLLLTTGDACNLVFEDSSFDVVVSFETIEHLKEPEKLLAEISRVLKPKGLCVCSSPNRDFMPSSGPKETNPFHFSEMTYEEFDQLFSRYFDISERFSQTHSEAYLRHLDFLRELDQRLKPIRFSRLLRIENKIRGMLGRNGLHFESLPERVGRATPGDYVIEPLYEASEKLLTLIFVGSKKS